MNMLPSRFRYSEGLRLLPICWPWPLTCVRWHHDCTKICYSSPAWVQNRMLMSWFRRRLVLVLVTWWQPPVISYHHCPASPCPLLTAHDRDLQFWHRRTLIFFTIFGEKVIIMPGQRVEAITRILCIVYTNVHRCDNWRTLLLTKIAKVVYFSACILWIISSS